MSRADDFSGVTVTTANDEKVRYAIECAESAKERGRNRVDTAEYIRNEFEKKFDTRWHCIVGRGYAHYTECDPGCKVKFAFEGYEIYLFRYKTGTEPKPSSRHYPHISPSDRNMIYDGEMDTEMENHVFDCCRRSCDYTSNEERAKYIKEEFDKEHNGGWNCVLGGNFASSVHYNAKSFISLQNFGKDNLQILLYRC